MGGASRRRLVEEEASPEKGELMLLLDSEALSALCRGPARRRDRVRALIAEMRARGLPVATVAAVLSEVVRRDRVQVHSVDSRVGVRAGRLLGAVRRGSTHAVDAFVVAVADLEGGAVIATADLGDMQMLAAHATDVVVASIDA